ncbi:hypothetical protein P5673_025573 [Acropora cervicornis]|uniref:Secreted protein n=1 Tax=Acropora cervicornis TaxID=6130 RepID=A0AAD9Q2E9_ACRCE|nr:hypothetical protein P5673_025573 [Acropora cervicornis]
MCVLVVFTIVIGGLAKQKFNMFGSYKCGMTPEERQLFLKTSKKKGETEFNDSPELTGRVQRRRMFQAQERERLPRRTSICIAARKLGCDCKKK